MAEEKSMQAVISEEKFSKCPDCGSTKIDKRGDEVFCLKCGYVFE